MIFNTYGISMNTYNTNPELCPVCKKNPLHPNKVMNSLSRRDNKTYICNECGQREAMEDYQKYLDTHGKSHESTPKD
jgi:hypothetical protein